MGLSSGRRTPLVVMLGLVLCCLMVLSPLHPVTAAVASTQPSVAGWIAFEELAGEESTKNTRRQVVLPYRQAQLLLRVKGPSSGSGATASTLLGAVPLSATGFFHYALPNHVNPSQVRLEVVPHFSPNSQPTKPDLSKYAAPTTWSVDQSDSQLVSRQIEHTGEDKEPESTRRAELRVNLRRQPATISPSARQSGEADVHSVMQRVVYAILGVGILLLFHFGANPLLKVLEFEIRPPGAAAKKNH